MTLYEYRSGPSFDLVELDDSFQPDYMAEHRELTDRERAEILWEAPDGLPTCSHCNKTLQCAYE
jgi:hypothetical protein